MYTQKSSPTERLMQAYESAYLYFRDQLIIPVLGEPLPDPILTFSRTKRKTAAFFLPDVWQAELHASERHCEIAIVPEHTAADPRELMSTLVHEMTHFVDHIAGTAPKSNGYHGKKWANRMELIGLPAVYASTKSRVSATHRIEPDGPFAKAYDALPKNILLPFVAGLHDVVQTIAGDETPSEEKATKSGKRFKYSCPKCETTMRGPAGRKLICGDCEVPYETESTE